MIFHLIIVLFHPALGSDEEQHLEQRKVRKLDALNIQLILHFVCEKVVIWLLASINAYINLKKFLHTHKTTLFI